MHEEALMTKALIVALAVLSVTGPAWADGLFSSHLPSNESCRAELGSLA
jgi:hypothetical protein